MRTSMQGSLTEVVNHLFGIQDQRQHNNIIPPPTQDHLLQCLPPLLYLMVLSSLLAASLPVPLLSSSHTAVHSSLFLSPCTDFFHQLSIPPLPGLASVSTLRPRGCYLSQLLQWGWVDGRCPVRGAGGNPLTMSKVTHLPPLNLLLQFWFLLSNILHRGSPQCCFLSCLYL